MAFPTFQAVLSTTENPEFKIVYQIVIQIPQTTFSFLSESFIFVFFSIIEFYYYIRDMKIELSQSLSCLYSTADGSNSAPTKIKGKLQYPHNST